MLNTDIKIFEGKFLKEVINAEKEYRTENNVEIMFSDLQVVHPGFGSNNFYLTVTYKYPENKNNEYDIIKKFVDKIKEYRFEAPNYIRGKRPDVIMVDDIENELANLNND